MPTTLPVQMDAPTADAGPGTQTCTRADGRLAWSQRVPPKCTHSQGSMNIETREGPHRINTRADSLLHTPHPQWEAPVLGPPLDTRVTILPPLVLHFAKASKPCTQSVCPARLLQCTQAMYTRTRPPWSDCAHQPPPLTPRSPFLP